MCPGNLISPHDLQYQGVQYSSLKVIMLLSSHRTRGCPIPDRVFVHHLQMLRETYLLSVSIICHHHHVPRHYLDLVGSSWEPHDLCNWRAVSLALFWPHTLCFCLL